MPSSPAKMTQNSPRVSPEFQPIFHGYHHPAIDPAVPKDRQGSKWEQNFMGPFNMASLYKHTCLTTKCLVGHMAQANV